MESKVVFSKGKAQNYDKYGKPILTAEKSDNIYYLKEIFTSDACLNDLEIWHYRVGHLNIKDLKRLEDKKINIRIKF